MKNIVEKTISVGLGIIILAVLSLTAVTFFGGSVMALLTLIIGFPMAFPLTTTLVIVVFGFIFWMKR